MKLKRGPFQLVEIGGDLEPQGLLSPNAPRSSDVPAKKSLKITPLTFRSKPPTSKPLPVKIGSDSKQILATTIQISEPRPAPKREYSCKNYNTCLDLAAALNWSSFSCDGCSGEVNQSLCWRAHHVEKRDKLVRLLCHIPAPEVLSGNGEDEAGGNHGTGPTRRPRRKVG